jgi:hypothetical protein
MESTLREYADVAVSFSVMEVVSVPLNQNGSYIKSRFTPCAKVAKTV